MLLTIREEVLLYRRSTGDLGLGIRGYLYNVRDEVLIEENQIFFEMLH